MDDNPYPSTVFHLLFSSPRKEDTNTTLDTPRKRLTVLSLRHPSPPIPTVSPPACHPSMSSNLDQSLDGTSPPPPLKYHPRCPTCRLTMTHRHHRRQPPDDSGGHPQGRPTRRTKSQQARRRTHFSGNNPVRN